MIDDASILRDILARECDTVNEYVRLAEKATREDVRDLVLHLAKEEKEHIAECARLLAHLDDEYLEYLKKPLSHAIGDSAPPAQDLFEDSTETPAPAAPPPQGKGIPGQGQAILASPYHFTIGSLISQ